jgi:hypothetical protein
VDEMHSQTVFLFPILWVVSRVLGEHGDIGSVLGAGEQQVFMIKISSTLIYEAE